MRKKSERTRAATNRKTGFRTKVRNSERAIYQKAPFRDRRRDFIVYFYYLLISLIRFLNSTIYDFVLTMPFINFVVETRGDLSTAYTIFKKSLFWFFLSSWGQPCIGPFSIQVPDIAIIFRHSWFPIRIYLWTKILKWTAFPS